MWRQIGSRESCSSSKLSWHTHSFPLAGNICRTQTHTRTVTACIQACRKCCAQPLMQSIVDVFVLNFAAVWHFKCCHLVWFMQLLATAAPAARMPDSLTDCTALPFGLSNFPFHFSGPVSSRRFFSAFCFLLSEESHTFLLTSLYTLEAWKSVSKLKLIFAQL